MADAPMSPEEFNEQVMVLTNRIKFIMEEYTPEVVTGAACRMIAIYCMIFKREAESMLPVIQAYMEAQAVGQSNSN